MFFQLIIVPPSRSFLYTAVAFNILCSLKYIAVKRLHFGSENTDPRFFSLRVFFFSPLFLAFLLVLRLFFFGRVSAAVFMYLGEFVG